MRRAALSSSSGFSLTVRSHRPIILPSILEGSNSSAWQSSLSRFPRPSTNTAHTTESPAEMSRPEMADFLERGFICQSSTDYSSVSAA